MRLAEALSIIASLGLGMLLGRLMERSRFLRYRSSGGIGRETGADRLYLYALALAVSWALLAASEPFSFGERMSVSQAGLPASAIAGLAAGALVGMLAAGPLSFTLQAAATRITGLILFFSWCAGVILGSRGFFAPAVGWLQRAGPRDARLSDLLGLPAWLLFIALAAILLIAILQAPVRVRIGELEWPKQGVGFGLLLFSAWALALYGGDLEGLNAVQAVDDLWEGFTGGRLWLQPSLLAGAGLALWGFLGACRRKDFFSSGFGSAGEIVFLALGGLLLGLACALAGADPAARLFFSVSSLNAGGLIFAFAFWVGARLAAALEARGKR